MILSNSSGSAHIKVHTLCSDLPFSSLFRRSHFPMEATSGRTRDGTANKDAVGFNSRFLVRGVTGSKVAWVVSSGYDQAEN